MATIIKTIAHVDSILDEINQAFFDIPFENSQFQTEAFVIAAAITPERAYRSIGLRMFAKIRALQESKFHRLNNEIDLDEIDEKIAKGSLDKYELRRETVKREKTKAEIQYSDKLINDAITELNILYKHFKALPKFTREQFEAGEKQHFIERLSRQHELSGDQQSLINLDEDMKALDVFEEETKFIEIVDNTHLRLLHNKALNIRANLEIKEADAEPCLKVLP